MLLGVNIDHVATLRNARGGDEPSVLEAALISQECGINAITVHLREDRRHIHDSDLKELKEKLTCKINLEMATTSEMLEIVLKTKPEFCCLVPEKRQEVTTEGGLDVSSNIPYYNEYVRKIQDNGTLVSLFIDPDIHQVEASKEIGTKFIELHTGAYANAFGKDNEEHEFQRLLTSAKRAQELGITVNAGHGLNYKNVLRMKEIPNLHELNIGHSIISRAIFVGLRQAVLEMKELI
ncbi:pyridoxine 5'-phosphate synthase [bacterium]|nr:pyridoxine 5'-phosphate synthase [bacterium]